ncbi:hypothetical protein BCR39DRAFT_529470 [Naematelia encephala]|uniref:Uncharacterized protein n=1 Tax=Naematelia encephala TaxID=71784 RepID=A0A1Y2B6Q8_9TREE|nr:hypothetical protein BCR39DRAFT_529470 [Naematelia encephala]
MDPNLAAVDPRALTYPPSQQDLRIFIAHSLGALSTIPNTLISLTPPETLLMLKPSIELIHQHVNTLGQLCGVHIPQYLLSWPQKDDDRYQVVRKRKKREEIIDVDSVCLSDHSDVTEAGNQQIRSESRIHSPLMITRLLRPALINPERIAKAKRARSARERLRLQPPIIPPTSCPPLSSDAPVTAPKTVHCATSTLDRPSPNPLQVRSSPDGRQGQRQQSLTLPTDPVDTSVGRRSLCVTNLLKPRPNPFILRRRAATPCYNPPDTSDSSEESLEDVKPVIHDRSNLPRSPSPDPLPEKRQIRSIPAGPASDRSNRSATNRIDVNPPMVGPAFKIDHPFFQYPARPVAERQIHRSGAWSTE